MNQNLEDGKTVPEPFALSSGALATQIICYDLRFPELLRYPSREGAQIAFYVAEWPTSRLNHWRSLLQARAMKMIFSSSHVMAQVMMEILNTLDIQWLSILMEIFLLS